LGGARPQPALSPGERESKVAVLKICLSGLQLPRLGRGKARETIVEIPEARRVGGPSLQILAIPGYLQAPDFTRRLDTD